MNDLRQKNNKADDEIDLSYFFEKIGNFFRGIFRSIKSGGQAIIRNWLFMLTFVLIGAALCFGLYKFTRPYYTSSMTLVLAEIRNDFVEDLLENLQVMVREKNETSLSRKLKISPEAAKQIKRIEFSSLDQERTDKDSILVGGPITVELSLYSNKYFDALETGITQYLESNEYFAKNKQVKTAYFQGLISKLDKDIASLDSIREITVAPKGPVNGFIYGEAIDPANLYREGVQILERRAGLEAQLKQLENLEVVAGFAPRLHPTGPNLVKYLAVGALAGFLIGLLLITLKEFKRKKTY